MQQHDDSKLLAAIAGVVIVGAVAIVVLSNVGDRVDDSNRADLPDPEPFAVPAVSTPSTEEESTIRLALATEAGKVSPVETEPLFVGPEREAQSEPQIVMDPSVDPVQGGLAAYRAREFELAALYFDAQAAARSDDAWARYMRGLSLWKAGRPDEAADAMREAATVDPDSIKTWLNLSRIENDRGDHEAAREAAKTALASDADHAEALFVLARSLYNLSQTTAALEALERSLAVEPDNGYAHNLRGLILIDRGDAQAAVDALERAVELEPALGFARNNLGMALELAGRRQEAVEAYRAAVEAAPGHVRASANLSRLAPQGLPDAPTAPAAAAVETAPDVGSDEAAITAAVRTAPGEAAEGGGD